MISQQAAHSKPFLYSELFKHSASAKECIDNAGEALITHGFTRQLLKGTSTNEQGRAIQGSVRGYLATDSVIAMIICDEELGSATLTVSGNNNELSSYKFKALVDADW